jgi:hypothetical protein
LLFQPRNVRQRTCDLRAIGESPENVEAVLVKQKRRFVLTLKQVRVGEVRPRVSGTQIVSNAIADGYSLFEVLHRAIEPPPRHFKLAEIVQCNRTSGLVSEPAHDVHFLL